MSWKNFSKNYKSRLANNEPAGTVIAEEYHSVIKSGITFLGGKFITGKVSLLKSSLTVSFNSMGASPLPAALIQGLTSYWAGGVYTYLPPLAFLPTSTPILPGTIPVLPLPTPPNIEFADVLVSLVFVPHLLTVNANASTLSVPPVLVPDIGFIVK